MKNAFIVSLLLLLPFAVFTQGVSCPAVVAGPDTTLPCNDCVLLHAQPVSGFTTTTYTTQTIPYNPYPYNAGTSILVNIDDVWGGVLPIGFNFCFYGQSYNQCVVGSNGVLSFDLSYANGYCAWPISQGIPGNTDVLNSILGPFHDIDPSVGGSIYWSQYGQAPCRVFVLSFYNIPMFSCNNMIATQQIVLYETTNIIEIYIQNKPTCAGWNSGAAIEGIQNATGSAAVVVPGRNFPGTWNAANDAYAFVPAGVQNYSLTWYEVGNPVPLTTNDTITVCPPGPSEYYAEVVYTNCDGSTVTVRDTATITASSSNMVITTAQSDAECNGSADGTAGITITGNNNPYTILWSNGQTTANITGLAAGTYTVTVTEQGGCAGVASVTINQPAPIALQTQHTNAICIGSATGTAGVTASGGAGGFTYSWSNGGNAANITGLVAGSYTVTVTDANGCINTASVTIADPAPIVLQTQHTDALCNGQASGTATVNASNGVAPYTYLWSNGQTTATATNLAVGTYTVTVTDANGCTASASAIIGQPAPVVPAATATDVICIHGNDGTGSASATGGTTPYLFVWSNGAVGANISGLSPGSYTVTVTDANGCSGITSITVNEPPAIQLSIAGATAVCEYETIDLTSQISGGVAPYTYLWTSVPNAVGDTNANLHYYDAHEDRTYWLTITDANGCTASASYLVESMPRPIVDFYPVNGTFCDSGTVQFVNLSTPVTSAFHWEFSDGTTADGLNPTHWFGSGIWSAELTVTDNFGCTTSLLKEQIVHIIPTPQASFTSDPNLTLIDHLLLSQATITFNNTSPWFATSVDWAFGDGDSAFVGQVTHSYYEPGNYCITMTAYNDFGCHTDVTQCIEIWQDPYLWVPTGFTPNGDGLNDVFLIGGLEIVKFEIEIYDRWGKLIYQSTDMTKGWDGKALGDFAQEGTYVFKINATNNEGKSVNREGTVTLVR